MIDHARPRPLVGMLDDWELRHDTSTAKGQGYVQLCKRGISIVTPSRATAGNFEALLDGKRITARTWKAMRSTLVQHGVVPPGRHALRAIETWFVLPNESPTGRLLRSWWAGQPITA
jgi:hypothetical protein